MLTGFPANSVFIVDSEDRVRHHTVLDPRFLVMMLIMYKFVDVDLLVGTGVDVDHPQGWMELAGGRKVGFRLQVCPGLLLLKCVHNFSSEHLPTKIILYLHTSGSGALMVVKALPCLAGSLRRTRWRTR